MSSELLMIVTSNGTLGDSGMPTGAWLEEVCVPLKAFRDAGLTVTIASPQGGRPPIDPHSAGFDTSAVPDLEARLDGTGVLAEADPGRYAAVFLAGGHGTMWDFPGNDALTQIVGSVASHGVVAAVCHGPAGLIGATGEGGKPLVAGRTITAFSDAEEDAAGASGIIPFSLQQRLAALGAFVEVAAPFTANVRRDGNLVTGQNPASSAAVAEAAIAAVRDLHR
ncbi:MAG TPA: type 1 glutamine amidotransferase domain-containing protein [Streptosporangiaceae bacterium]